MPGWQAVQEQVGKENLTIIAAAQDTGGEAVAGEWYDKAEASYVTLVDENHTISSLFNLVNVPSAVWIDESGKVIRIDEGAYAMKHKTPDFEFGRDDYAPMVVDWAKQGAKSEYAKSNSIPDLALTNDQALAEASFKLGVYFHEAGNEPLANRYWEQAEALNPDSWNYHRQDWSFTPGEAGGHWMKKSHGYEK